MIAIVDYGMGNIGSLENMIRKAGGASRVTSNPAEVLQAEKLILPGVGAFDNGISKLNRSGLAAALTTRIVRDHIPILCICLGMQLITEGSEEGTLPGLGWVPGRTIRFKFEPSADLKIPHMGWNNVRFVKDSPLSAALPEDARFYFVHSYHVVCRDPQDVLTTTTYGIEFTSSLQHGKIYATQFHPEKSLKYGLQLIRNFLAI